MTLITKSLIRFCPDDYEPHPSEKLAIHLDLESLKTEITKFIKNSKNWNYYCLDCQRVSDVLTGNIVSPQAECEKFHELLRKDSNWKEVLALLFEIPKEALG